jgi:hypothetical protein
MFKKKLSRARRGGAGGSAAFEPAPRATARLKLAVGSFFCRCSAWPTPPSNCPPTCRRQRPARRELLQEIEISGAKTSSFKNSLQAAATARENDQLRALLGWQRQAPWKLKLANVVMRDPANWWRTVQIDLGSRDGLR